MTNARQSAKESQVIVSIMEELETYNDAVLQVERKNREYHSQTYAYLNTSVARRR